jgi:hypothetical protein
MSIWQKKKIDEKSISNFRLWQLLVLFCTVYLGNCRRMRKSVVILLEVLNEFIEILEAPRSL